MVSWPTLRSSAAIWASYSAMTLASASSSFSAPRSNCVSHSWMRLAETPYVRCASRRPMTPYRISWQSCNLNGVECRRYGPRDFMSPSPIEACRVYQFFRAPWSSPKGALHPKGSLHSVSKSARNKWPLPSQTSRLQQRFCCNAIWEAQVSQSMRTHMSTLVTETDVQIINRRDCGSHF